MNLRGTYRLKKEKTKKRFTVVGSWDISQGAWTASFLMNLPLSNLPRLKYQDGLGNRPRKLEDPFGKRYLTRVLGMTGILNANITDV